MHQMSPKEITQNDDLRLYMGFNLGSWQVDCEFRKSSFKINNLLSVVTQA